MYCEDFWDTLFISTLAHSLDSSINQEVGGDISYARQPGGCLFWKRKSQFQQSSFIFGWFRCLYDYYTQVELYKNSLTI